jgi:TolA-binding protein
MKRFVSGVCLSSFLAFGVGYGSAQVRPQTGATGTGAQTTSGAQRGRQQPCWQVAGVSQQALQQHRQIEESTRSQVEAVCSNSSLSQQQKQQQIRQLRENARKQMASIVSPQQEEALRSCRESRGEGRAAGSRREGGSGGAAAAGPCGEIPDTSSAKPSNSSEPIR